jgi:geranylgeranyl pyrophosphate synthase
VEETCIASLELKSGALVALAVQLGACVAGADTHLISKLGESAYGLGLALQMYDDAGNFAGDGGEVLLGPGLVKQMEDLRLKRPSWLWAVAARLSADDQDYAEFVGAVRVLPNVERINAWAQRKDWIRTARLEAAEHAARVGAEFERNWRGLPALDRMRGFLNQLSRAYGRAESSRP